MSTVDMIGEMSSIWTPVWLAGGWSLERQAPPRGEQLCEGSTEILPTRIRGGRVLQEVSCWLQSRQEPVMLFR